MFPFRVTVTPVNVFPGDSNPAMLRLENEVPLFPNANVPETWSVPHVHVLRSVEVAASAALNGRLRVAESESKR